MAKKTEKSPDEIQRVYLFKGKDDARKHKALDELTSQLLDPSFTDWDMELLDGDSTTTDKISAGVSSPPFGSQRRVVVVRQANKILPPEQEAIAAFIPKVPESACLIFVVPPPDLVDGKPRKGSEISAALSKAISKAGEVKDFGALKPDAAEAFVVAEFARYSKKADRITANLLVRRVGTDTTVLSTEIVKLVHYTGDNKSVTADDVNEVTIETPEEKVFALIDAISAKNEAQALHHLDDVFSSGGKSDSEAPRLLVLIARQLRLLWQFSYLREMGLDPRTPMSLPEEVTKWLPSEPNILDIAKRQPWLMEKLAKQLRNFERTDLERGFSLILMTDASLKGIEGSVDDPKTAMELLVLGLCKRSKKG